MQTLHDTRLFQDDMAEFRQFDSTGRADQEWYT